MTIECVDGQMATPHITGAQKGAMHAGVVGDGCYVLATGNKCKATQNSATSVTIGTGDLFIHGRHHQITAAETVTIQSGTQGQKRNDLICAVYHRDAQGIEQPTVTVLKGTPTTGTPADPTVPAGNVLNGDAVDYFPLYRVSLNGTTASAPVQLFKVLPTLASLGDSVSRARNALILSEDVHVSGYKGIISVRHDGFGTVAERYDEAGFVVDEETFVQVSGILWTDNEAGTAWPALVKAPWQPDDLKDYWCAKMPVEVAKKGAGSVAHRTHFDRDCALYISAAANGSIVYSGVTTKRLFTSTDGYIYIALHKAKPDAVPAIIYVDTTVPLSSL